MRVDQDNQLTGSIIGAAIAVHRALGPGLDEVAYESALSAKLTTLGVPHERQPPMPLRYRDVALDCGFRLDVLVEERLPVELKAVEVLLPIHDAQLLTYMRLGGHPLGLLLNLEVPVLKDGIRRLVQTGAGVAPMDSPTEVRAGFDALSAEVLNSAVAVHRALGPGLLRSAYEECLCHELRVRQIPFARQASVPVEFEGQSLPPAEIPLLVGGVLPVYSLSVACLSALHEATLLARMRQAKFPHGLLVNFNSESLTHSTRRLTL